MTDHITTLERLKREAVGLSREDHEALRAAIALMRGQSWQPIDSAPMEGRFIALVGGRAATVEAGRQYVKWPHEEGGPTYRHVWNEVGSDFICPCNPKGWIPFPAPPKDTADEQ